MGLAVEYTSYPHIDKWYMGSCIFLELVTHNRHITVEEKMRVKREEDACGNIGYSSTLGKDGIDP